MKLNKKKNPGQMYSHVNSTKHLKKREDLMPILKLSKKKRGGGRKLPSTFYKTSGTLIQKPDKNTLRRQQANIPDDTEAKASTKCQQATFDNSLKGSFTTVKWALFLGSKNSSIFRNQHDTPLQ